MNKFYKTLNTLLKYIDKYIIYLLLLESAVAIIVRIFFEAGNNKEKIEFILSIIFVTFIFRYFMYFLLWIQLKNASCSKRYLKFGIIFFTIGGLFLIFNPIINYENSNSIIQIITISAILSGVARFNVKNEEAIEQKF